MEWVERSGGGGGGGSFGITGKRGGVKEWEGGSFGLGGKEWEWSGVKGKAMMEYGWKGVAMEGVDVLVELVQRGGGKGRG